LLIIVFFKGAIDGGTLQFKKVDKTKQFETVKFKTPFPNQPKVLCGFHGFVLSQNHSQRARVAVSSVYESFIMVEVQSWKHSTSPELYVTWIAFDPALLAKKGIIDIVILMYFRTV
jgi:hypothetical protein